MVMAAPSALVLTCGLCGSVAPHRVLRGKIGGGGEIVFEGVVKCSACGFVSSVVTRGPKPIEVPLGGAWLGKSGKTALGVSPEEGVHGGEALDLRDSRLSITAIHA